MIGAKVLYGLNVFHLSAQEDKMLSYTQRIVTSRLIRWPYLPQSTWQGRWIQHQRHIKNILHNIGYSLHWSALVAKHKLRPGHIVRHPENLSHHVLMYRNQQWWRLRQIHIRPGSPKFRHPKRFNHRNWESDVEGCVNSIPNHWILEDYFAQEGEPLTQWTQLALHRQLWTKLLT